MDLKKRSPNMSDQKPKDATQRPDLTDAQIDRLAIDIIRLMDGLRVAQAEYVLDQAKFLLKSNNRIDVNSPLFMKFVSWNASLASSAGESHK